MPIFIELACWKYISRSEIKFRLSIFLFGKVFLRLIPGLIYMSEYSEILENSKLSILGSIISKSLF